MTTAEEFPETSIIELTRGLPGAISEEELEQHGFVGISEQSRLLGEQDSLVMVAADDDRIVAGTLMRDGEQWVVFMHAIYVGRFTTKDLACAALELAWYG